MAHTKPPADQIERLAALAAWHDEWSTPKLNTAPFNPQGRKAGSDYNQHYVDLEDDDDDFHEAARRIMGLPPIADRESGTSDDEDPGDIQPGSDEHALVTAMHEIAPKDGRAASEIAMLEIRAKALRAADADRGFNPAAHPRNPKGAAGGGRFRSMVDRIKDALDQHHNDGGTGDPLAGFNREQLRKVAKARGLELKRGEDEDSIKRKLLDDLHVGGPDGNDDGVKKKAPKVGKAATKKVATWDELGKPQGPPPVGQLIGHEGGTYELLPGEPRRYRVINADGKDISGTIAVGYKMDGTPGHQTAEDARTALRVDAYDRARVKQAHESGAVEAWDAIPGSWSYADGQAKGFGGATTKERAQIRKALGRWTGHKSTYDGIRNAEPTVNAALRGAIPIDADIQADIYALDRALDLSRTSKPITVYRGVTDGSHILPDDWQSRDLAGLEWSNVGYTPTTGNLEAAEEYTGPRENRGFSMRLRLPEGFPAVAIRDDIGGLDDEGEIVLPRGMSFRVVQDNGPQGEHGLRLLDVEIVEDDGSTAPEAKIGSSAAHGNQRADRLAASQLKAGQAAAGVGVKEPSLAKKRRQARIEAQTNAALDEADRKEAAKRSSANVAAAEVAGTGDPHDARADDAQRIQDDAPSDVWELARFGETVELTAGEVRSLLPPDYRAAGHDTTLGHDELHHYWTKDAEGLAKWVNSPKPWTTLVGHLASKVGLLKAKIFASRWFIEHFHYAAGSDKNRVAHGHPPRGKKIGPG